MIDIKSVLNELKINAVVVNVNEDEGYSNVDLQLQGKSKIKDLERHAVEIGLAVKQGKPVIKPLYESGLVRLEFIHKRKEILSYFDQSFKTPKGDTQCYIGDTVDNEPVFMNLCENPHLLVAGTTGSGKSTFFHTLIANMVNMKNSKIYLIDPKCIEFNAYKTFGNVEVIETYNNTLKLFKLLVKVMNHRYHVMRDGAVKSQLPYIFVLIDEFADLILQDSTKELYENLVMLAQKSRAAKIHLILGTQRPTVNFVNGTIKANFPARISFRVPSHIDSKVILDTIGAENLHGSGDGYLKDHRYPMLRFQSAFTTPEEVVANNSHLVTNKVTDSLLDSEVKESPILDFAQSAIKSKFVTSTVETVAKQLARSALRNGIKGILSSGKKF